MSDHFPNKDITIRYILGETVDKNFEKEYLSDENGLEYVTIIEEELILDYIRGTLKSKYRKMFEKRFLHSPEWQEKVESTRVFMDAFQKISLAAETTKSEGYFERSFNIIKNHIKSLLTLPRPKNITEPFWPWLGRVALSKSGLLWLAPATVLAAIMLIGMLEELSWAFSMHTWVVLVVLGQIFVSAKPENYFNRAVDERHKRSTLANCQFWTWWPRAWASWCIFYILLTLESFGVIPNIEPLKHLLNNLNSVYLICCFYVLRYQTIDTTKVVITANQNKILLPGYHPSSGTVGNLESTEKVLGEKSLDWIKALIVGVILLFVAELLQSSTDVNRLYYDFFAAFFGTVAMICLVGKLTESFLEVPKTVIFLLFFYVGIQVPLSLLLNKEIVIQFNNQSTEAIIDNIKAIMLTIALFGKVFLFTTLQWLLTSRNMQFYMEQAATVLETSPGVKRDWEKEFSMN